MSQKRAFDRLSNEHRKMVISLLNENRLTQLDIVNRVNDEAGKHVISKTSLNRFVKNYRKEQADKKATSSINSLERIATALERIASSLENQYKKQS